MKIIDVYFFNIAWYAKVQLNGNGIVELKFRQAQKPTNAAILQRATDYKQALADAKVAQDQAELEARERASRLKIEADDLGSLTMQQLNSKLTNLLTNRPALRTALVKNVIQVGD